MCHRYESSVRTELGCSRAQVTIHQPLQYAQRAQDLREKRAGVGDESETRVTRPQCSESAVQIHGLLEGLTAHRVTAFDRKPGNGGGFEEYDCVVPG